MLPQDGLFWQIGGREKPAWADPKRVSARKGMIELILHRVLNGEQYTIGYYRSQENIWLFSN
jgi:hypothetical protein